MPTRDLSHSLDDGTWTYPGDPPVSVEPHATLAGDGYRVSSLSLGTHAGTHLDAPSHTEADGATVDDLPVESFAFDAVVARLDVVVDAREPIEPDRFPPVPDDADCLVLDTGWATRWCTDRYLDHPYLTVEAAAWCADRGLSVALDAPSVDPSCSADATEDGSPGEAPPGGNPAHHALFGSSRIIVENLANLDGLPNRFELRAYPLPIVGGDGAPVRAIAVYQ